MTTCQTAPTTYHVTVPTNPVGQYHWSTCLSERRRLNSQEVQLGVENFRLVCCWSRPRQQPWLNPTREIIWHRRMSGREKDFLIQNGRSSREKWAKKSFFIHSYSDSPHSFFRLLWLPVVRFWTKFQSKLSPILLYHTSAPFTASLISWHPYCRWRFYLSKPQTALSQIITQPSIGG